MSDAPIRIKAQGKVVGKVVGNIFRKNLDSRRHFLRRPPAIALDRKSLDDAKAAGAEVVAIKDENEKWHIALVELVELKGFLINRKHGDQIALGLWHWKDTTREAEAELARVKDPPPEPAKELGQEMLFK